MTTRRILAGALLAAALFLTGCGRSDSEPKSSEDHVQSAIEGLNANRSLEDVKIDVRHAIENLPTADTAPKEVGEVRQTLTDVQNKLTPEELKRDKKGLVEKLQSAAQKLAAIPKPESSLGRPWRQWITYGVVILGAILVACALLTALRYTWKRAWRNVEINVARVVTGHVGSARIAQPDFSDKFTSLATSQKEITNKLDDVTTDVRSLARMVRESLAERNDRRPTSLPLTDPTYSDGAPAQKEEPEFPVSVYDYLGKMSRFANAVKLDFQNGILVNDLEKKDELFLIKGSRESDDNRPLFLVPGAAQFHNKQDFEIYYAKYYECAKPAMGDVWIIGPAVVEKVPGGWKLRDKGMLEVR